MKEFSADIEARVKRWPEGGDEADAMFSLLEALDGLGAMGAVAHGRLSQLVGARFHVAASSPEKAVLRALEIFRAAAEKVGVLTGEIERVEAVTDERLQRDLEEPAEQDPYLGVAEVARLLGVSRQRVSELRGRPGFPEPVAELASGPVWRGWQLRRFLEEWPRRPGRPRADEELLEAARRLPPEALERLAPRQREVVELARRGRRLSWIAEALGLKRATVRAYLRRAVDVLGEDRFPLGKVIGDPIHVPDPFEDQPAMPRVRERETAVGGALRRVASNVWVWADTGQREPRVTDLTLRDLAPNYRVIRRGERHFVEVPELWRKDVSDPDVEEAITHLLAAHGRPADIYAEGLAELLDDHRARSRGYLVPLEAWDEAMSRVIGCQWDRADEEEIMARAEQARRRSAADAGL